MMAQALIDRHLKHIPIVDKARERELIIRAQKGQEAAMLELFASNYRYIFRFLRKNGVMRRADKEDVFQEAVVGYCEAVKRFDFSYENRFAQYLFQWMRERVFSYLTRNQHIVELPRNEFFSLLHKKMKLIRRLGLISFVDVRDIFIREVGFSKWLPEHDEMLRLYLFSLDSLNRRIRVHGGEVRILQDTIPNPYSLEFNQFHVAEKKESYFFLRKAFRSRELSRVERAVVYCRFFRAMSTRETSEYLVAHRTRGRVVSRQMINVIEARALRKLKKILQKAGMRESE